MSPIDGSPPWATGCLCGVSRSRRAPARCLHRRHLGLGVGRVNHLRSRSRARVCPRRQRRAAVTDGRPSAAAASGSASTGETGTASADTGGNSGAGQGAAPLAGAAAAPRPVVLGPVLGPEAARTWEVGPVRAVPARTAGLAAQTVARTPCRTGDALGQGGQATRETTRICLDLGIGGWRARGLRRCRVVCCSGGAARPDHRGNDQATPRGLPWLTLLLRASGLAG